MNRNKEEVALIFQASIDGKKSGILVDTGATHDYVPAEKVSPDDLIPVYNKTVTVGDGRAVPISGLVKRTIQMGTLTFTTLGSRSCRV